MGWFVVAYTAPPVNYMSGPIVVVIVGLLAVSVVLAFIFASPLAQRLVERHENEHPPRAPTPDAGVDPGSPWSTHAP